jgi:translation initiation factor 2B subunit (eIF-2B alpha/beta/delta family)
MDVQLMADAVAAQGVAQVDAIWVGADGLGERGLLNKVGTHALASAARREGVPFYALCGTDKIAPAGYYLLPQAQITTEFFDLTPLDLLFAAITEKGRLSARGILEYGALVPLHPALS